MKINDSIAARPVATSIDPVTNQVRYFQLHTDGNFYPEIDYFERFYPNHSAFFYKQLISPFCELSLIQRRDNITLLKITDEYQKVVQRRPVDFEIRDEILEKALKNKPNDYMKLEQNIERSLQMSR